MSVPTLQAVRTATPGASDPVLRAEYPPAHYWRRWAADAPAPANAGATQSRPDIGVAADSPPSLVPAGEEAPYRVLVVEDDLSQALFAEQVLGGAGLQVQVVARPADLLPALHAFHPDLVLMDLHMPEMSGIEMTALIRAQPQFAPVPIVFLTGDPDPEKQFEVLECGADDFLSKPIRPRHLIAAVQSRIKRARTLARQRFGAEARNPVTGLHTRAHALQRIAAALAGGGSGGVLFVEIQSAAALSERYGYAGYEQLMHEVGLRASEVAAPRPCARLNDNAFLVFAPECSPATLEELARRLRDGIGHASFDCGGMPQRLRVAVGYTDLDPAHGFGDAGAVLDAVEQATRIARSAPIGLAAHVAETAGSHRDLSDRLRGALRKGDFALQFQPVVAVAGGEEAQFQVLLRLRDADGTLRSAGEFVPAAEAAGLMPEIDRWVLEQTIPLLQRRRDEGRPIRLFVSQSPRTLARDVHATWLLEMLASHGLDGPSLVVDLRLEDALVHSVTLRQFSEQLMHAGVQFCLSQYAHGPDAEPLLQQLPLGYLRLSGRYSRAHTDAALRDELRGIIDRAHRHGLQVIGPQVEDPQGAATLWMSGIDFIQGNLVQQAAGELDFDFQHSVL
jgi:EAL domain-containing protein (putative c-di-GMP-specific phosphodiesterase class I)/CheY-like chemotaxis protein